MGLKESGSLTPEREDAVDERVSAALKKDSAFSEASSASSDLWQRLGKLRPSTITHGSVWVFLRTALTSGGPVYRPASLKARRRESAL